ncbi:MAG TPA: hypothetical protein VGD08_04010 [Stellaceae bacterium]|jgi:hypothetical protein
MNDAYVIETQERTAGIAVRDHDGFRFYASDPDFYRIDNRTFRGLRALRAAVEGLAEHIATGRSRPALQKRLSHSAFRRRRRAPAAA